MDCKTVTAPIKTCLYADHPAGSAMDFMVEKHMGPVPVTNRDGTFAGLISEEQLMGHLLPRAITAFGGMKHARYFSESAEDMNERLASLRGVPIGNLMDRDTRVATPDTPLIDALIRFSPHPF